MSCLDKIGMVFWTAAILILKPEWARLKSQHHAVAKKKSAAALLRMLFGGRFVEMLNSSWSFDGTKATTLNKIQNF